MRTTALFKILENKPQLIDTRDENLWITSVEKMEILHDKMCTIFLKTGKGSTCVYKLCATGGKAV